MKRILLSFLAVMAWLVVYPRMSGEDAAWANDAKEEAGATATAKKARKAPAEGQEAEKDADEAEQDGKEADKGDADAKEAKPAAKKKGEGGDAAWGAGAKEDAGWADVKLPVRVHCGRVLRAERTSEAVQWRDMERVLGMKHFRPVAGEDPRTVIERAPAEGRVYVIVTVEVEPKRSIGRYDYVIRHKARGGMSPCLGLAWSDLPFDERNWQGMPKNDAVEVKLLFEVPEDQDGGELTFALPITLEQAPVPLAFPGPKEEKAVDEPEEEEAAEEAKPVKGEDAEEAKAAETAEDGKKPEKKAAAKPAKEGDEAKPKADTAKDGKGAEAKPAPAKAKENSDWL